MSNLSGVLTYAFLVINFLTIFFITFGFLYDYDAYIDNFLPMLFIVFILQGISLFALDWYSVKYDKKAKQEREIFKIKNKMPNFPRAKKPLLPSSLQLFSATIYLIIGFSGLFLLVF